ncbi:MAG: molecular chaperone HtpG [Alphaproteobacteria bacterium]|nr:molecular chaperone HtpG [Alphaproteobacteria bacterium]
MAEEQLKFEAEVSRLLDIVVNALYSEKEIFLRELISNASDACDKLRYESLTQPNLTEGDAGYRIALTADGDAKTLTIADNGIGMSRDDLKENLGTIAKSGTKGFLDALEQQGTGDTKKDVNLIGQFGVGFYSAFMVAKKIEVLSRRAGETAANLWTSEGAGSFTIADAEKESRGTTITLHLKDDAGEFLEAARLRQIVKRYSDHIAIPVVLTGQSEDGQGEKKDEEETLNKASALWTRPKSDITEDDYKEFYHHVAHAFDAPWDTLHWKAEGVIEYTGLLFIPESRPFDIFNPERKHGVKLYVRRVFITDDCQGLVPEYLRFLRGVIDSEDLPLNVSREMLQHNPVLTKIKAGLTKRVLGDLKKRAANDAEGYTKFWEAFGPVLKEGIYSEQGDERTKILGISRFKSTFSMGEGGDDWVSLDDYIGRMRDGQDTIFYISGQDADALAKSPQIEGFKAKGVEVLLLTDPVDEFWIPQVGEYEGKGFKSVTRGGSDLSKIKKEGEADKDEAETTDAEMESSDADGLIALMKLTLKEDVADVRASERLTDSPVCLVADETGLDMNLERMLRQHQQLDALSKRVLEVNPNHPLVKKLAASVKEKGNQAGIDDAAYLLLDQARIVEGEPLPDPQAFARRMASALERAF